eukprot:gene1642-2861_t
MHRLKDKAATEVILDDLWCSLDGHPAEAAGEGRPGRNLAQGSRDDAYILRLEQEVLGLEAEIASARQEAASLPSDHRTHLDDIHVTPWQASLASSIESDLASLQQAMLGRQAEREFRKCLLRARISVLEQDFHTKTVQQEELVLQLSGSNLIIMSLEHLPASCQEAHALLLLWGFMPHAVSRQPRQPLHL